jgi:hypothetical protein
MGHSRKKTPIIGNAVADSEKADKVLAHRAERRKVRQSVAEDADAIPHPKEYGNPWTCAKDGRRWIGDRHPRLLRK